ncbi:hypothetical protein [Desulfosporosinus sp. SB140]|uniref:hypothetical protein n=1 Tax=Desulfosporosinus paludis TaxID=3115649 RepID=UPI003891093A
MKKYIKGMIIVGVAAVIVIGSVIIRVNKENKGVEGSAVNVSAQTDVERNNSPNQPSPDFLPGAKFTSEDSKEDNNRFVFDSRRADFDGDGKVDDVVLIGEKQDDNPYVQNIGVAIKDSHTGKFSIASIGELNSGLDPKLFIGSFNKAKSNDILVSFATGGSGGVYQFSLLSYHDGQVKAIVPQETLNHGLVLETQCLPGFNLKITDKNTGYTATIDLHKGSVDYERLGIYNEKGELLQDPMVLVDGFSVLKPEVNGDGICELRGIQRISVGAHANSVANAESVWKVSNGQLKLLSENIEALN